ncbi:hypothetical protein IFM89_029337 [Coptis chinensis]|uniref:Uncharacterized protein n=1 Tax=Coptis chinensis TaxID=261450 RepID=A0A835IS76_9MAGN|nr:hypothetical protein IFM89_029337 [Coptis chinensis]
MGNPSATLIELMFLISLSFSVTSFLVHKQQPATPKDLLSILGTKDQASKVNSNVAHSLKACLKFLVPFSPNDDGRRSTVEIHSNNNNNDLIWWPPPSVMGLARLSLDSGADPGAIQRALDPTVLPVPDVEGSKQHRCELTRTPYGRRFISQELNSYFAFLFELIAARGPAVGLYVSLNRFDLFHGHLFLATDSGRVGILFHAKEYPAYEKDVFPYNMGYCQIGSNVAYDDMMNLRNILWLAPLPSNATKAWIAPGVLVVLDASPEGIIYKDLIPEYVDYARTIYEGLFYFAFRPLFWNTIAPFYWDENFDMMSLIPPENFGDVVVDVNYLNVGSTVADHKIYIC